jgi:hypothetical protein
MIVRFTKLPVQTVRGFLTEGKSAGASSTHKPSAKVKNEWSYTTTPPIHMAVTLS